MEKSKTFCILPWIHAATYTDGSVLLCCVANSSNLNLNNVNWQTAWNSDYFKRARLTMLKGNEFPDCASCYNNEKSGVKSHRQIQNFLWYKKLGAEYLDGLVTKTESDGKVNNNIIALDLRLGNTCNLQCIMCRPTDSSKWLKDAEKLSNELTTEAKWDWKWKIENFTIENFEWYKDPAFWEDFYERAYDIKHIVIGGGEPMLLKEHKELLLQLVDRGLSNNIELRYHTNGTIYSQEIVNLWTKFKLVEVMISLDGHKEVNDYIRYPSNWELLEKNLDLYDNTESMIDIKILCTVQALNLYYLPDFADWLLSKNYKKIGKTAHDGLFHTGILHWPRYLSVKVLPKNLKDKITKKILNYSVKNKTNKTIVNFNNLITLMNSEDHSEMFIQMKEYLEKLDELHGTDYMKLGDFFL